MSRCFSYSCSASSKQLSCRREIRKNAPRQACTPTSSPPRFDSTYSSPVKLYSITRMPPKRPRTKKQDVDYVQHGLSDSDYEGACSALQSVRAVKQGRVELHIYRTLLSPSHAPDTDLFQPPTLQPPRRPRRRPPKPEAARAKAKAKLRRYLVQTCRLCC